MLIERDKRSNTISFLMKQPYVFALFLIKNKNNKLTHNFFKEYKGEGKGMV